MDPEQHHDLQYRQQNQEEEASQEIDTSLQENNNLINQGSKPGIQALEIDQAPETLAEESDQGYESKNDKFLRQQKEKQEKTKETQSQILKSAVALMVLGLAQYLFVYKMEAQCDTKKFEKDEDCIEGVLVPQISVWLRIILVCSVMIMSVFLLSIAKKLPKCFIYICLAQMLYLSAFHYDVDPNNITLRNYEGATALFLGGFFLIIGFSALGVYTCIKIYQKKKIMFYMGVFITFFILILLNNRIVHSCDNWEQGLNGEINNEQPYCKVETPGICWPVVIDNMLNFGPKSCEVKDKTQYIKNLLQEYELIQPEQPQDQIDALINNLKYLAWPLTNKFTTEERTPRKIQPNIIKQSKILNSVEEATEQNLEAVIDVQNTELKINVKRNETLVESRKTEQFEGVDSMAKNVIIIYIDTVSRTQSFRKLKKTMSFFKRYAGTNYKDTTEAEDFDEQTNTKYKKNKTTFEFFRYHSIDKQTFSNLFQLHYGYQKPRVYAALRKAIHEFTQAKKKKSLFNDFKDAGYIVGHAMNTCSCKCIFRDFVSGKDNVQKYFYDEPADHELMILDPLYVNKKNYFDTSRGVNSVYRRCLYGKDTNEHAFDYGLQFLKEYKDEKKMLYLEYTDGHEITSEVVQYIDEPLHNFLTNIESEGMLEKDTMVYMLSDHGQHLVSAFYLFGQVQGKKSEKINDVFQTERMLPMIYMIVTNDLLRKHEYLGPHLEINSQGIFTMGEIRNTLHQTMFGKEKYNQIKQEEEESRKQEKKKNPKLEFCGVNYDKNMFEILDMEKTCYDIGMIDFDDPSKFCSCRPRDEAISPPDNDDEEEDNNNGSFLDKDSGKL